MSLEYWGIPDCGGFYFFAYAHWSTYFESSRTWNLMASLEALLFPPLVSCSC